MYHQVIPPVVTIYIILLAAFITVASAEIKKHHKIKIKNDHNLLAI